VPVGTVSLVVKQGATTTYSASKAVAQNAAAFTLPKEKAGSYSYTLSYTGDDQIASFTKSGTVTVTKVKGTKVAGATSKTPTSKAAGKYKVTVTAPAGLAKAAGAVTVKLKKGATTKTVAGILVNGVVTVIVPKLAKGTWTAAIAYAGDSDYLAA
jgi:hypothetical protein